MTADVGGHRSLRSGVMQHHMSPLPAPLTSALRRLRQIVLVRRRMLAAALMALAVLAGVRATTAPPEPTAPVVVARTDLAGGTTVRAADLQVVDHPASAVPAGATGSPRSVAGRVLAAPVRRGEPVTDVRVVGRGLLGGYPGAVAAPVRVADPGVARLLHVGDRIDLISTPPEGGGSSVVVSGAPVVAVPRASADRDGMMSGGLVVVAVSPASALSLAEASVSSVLSATLTG